jgi:ribonuclease HI
LIEREFNVYCFGVSNKKVGAWCFTIYDNCGVAQILKRNRKKNATENEMCLTAIVHALSYLKEGANISIIVNNKFIYDTIEQGWAKTWLRNGWRTSTTNKEVEHKELWAQVIALMSLANECTVMHSQCIEYSEMRGMFVRESVERALSYTNKLVQEEIE